MDRPGSSRTRPLRASGIALALVVAALVAAGCEAPDTGGGDAAPESQPTKAAGEGERPTSMLMLDGQVAVSERDAATTRPATLRDRTYRATDRTPGAAAPARHRALPAPPLLPDGRIDDGVDPFAVGVVPSLPIPVEDDPTLSAALDTWRDALRTVDDGAWDQWMARGSQPWDQQSDDVMPHVVEVAAMRCGGARTIATGVVLAPETVVTTTHVVESIQRRARVRAASQGGERYPALVRYLDVDDDIAVLRVPGLDIAPLAMRTSGGSDEPRPGYAYGVGTGGGNGVLRRVPVLVQDAEVVADLEQPDGFAERITHRSVMPVLGGIDTGFSGGVVARGGGDSWGDGDLAFHGLVRARTVGRANGGGIVVPGRLVRDAIAAANRLDPWFEHRPGRCPQWHR